MTFRDENSLLVVVLFCGPSRPDSLEQVEQLRSILENEYGPVQKAFLGQKVPDPRGIADSYRDALALWRSSSRNIVQTRSQESALARLPETLRVCQQELEVCLDDRELALQTFQDIFEELRSFQLPLSHQKQFCFHLLNDAYYTWMRKAGRNVDQSLVNLIGRCQTAQREEEILQLGRSFLEQMLAGGEQSEDVIANAKRYIAQHLEESLSVNQLAEKFYLSVGEYKKTMVQFVCGTHPYDGYPPELCMKCGQQFCDF